MGARTSPIYPFGTTYALSHTWKSERFIRNPSLNRMERIRTPLYSQPVRRKVGRIEEHRNEAWKQTATGFHMCPKLIWDPSLKDGITSLKSIQLEGEDIVTSSKATKCSTNTLKWPKKAWNFASVGNRQKILPQSFQFVNCTERCDVTVRKHLRGSKSFSETLCDCLSIMPSAKSIPGNLQQHLKLPYKHLFARHHHSLAKKQRIRVMVGKNYITRTSSLRPFYVHTAQLLSHSLDFKQNRNWLAYCFDCAIVQD